MRGFDTKIERAKEHVRELEIAIKRWTDGDPYRVVVESEIKTRDEIYRVQIREELPPRFAAVAGDAIHNLRSALDFIICDLVLANGGEVLKATGFPVAVDAESLETKGLGKVKGAARSVRKRVKAMQPYKGGNDALWILHKLDIADKHRLLLVVGGQQWSNDLDAADFMRQAFPGSIPDDVTLVLGLHPGDTSFPLEDGAELWRVLDAPAQERKPKVNFTLEVSINETGIVEREPIIKLLSQLVQVVEATIADLRRFL